MHRRFKIQPAILALAAILALLPGAQAQSVLARAEVNPSVIMAGETGKYSIRFLNATSVPNLNTPRVDGLDFSGTPGTSSYQQIINGRISVKTELSWSFRPAREGSFVIPGRTIEINGEEIRIPDVELQVVPMDEEARSRAMLKLQLPEPPYYVGQALPARLSLLVRRDLNLSNVALPDATGEAFVHSEFDNNHVRGTVREQGRLYNELAWEILITPIKSGTALIQFSQDVAIQISSPDNRFPSIFSMSRSRTETYRLFSDDLTTEILALPAGDKPESFSGAIGSFTLEANLASRDLQVGEPVTFTLTLEGEGNFERISPPELPEWPDWRIYPPKVNFTPGDARGYTGSKSFEYILIPQSTDITELPGFTLGIFNPQEQAYQTLASEPRPVSVRPSDKPETEGLFLADNGESSAPAKVSVPERILPIRPEPGRFHPVGRAASIRSGP
jgi:hypothetical protein